MVELGSQAKFVVFFLRCYLNPERNDLLEGDAPAATKVEAFLARALETVGGDADITAGALVPWICDALLSNPKPSVMQGSLGRHSSI